MSAAPPPRPFDPQAELARERNFLAAERTLLSFIRTSLTLISVGVGTEQILRALLPGSRAIDGWAYGLSLGFVGLGVLSLVLATVDHRTELRRLRAAEYRYTPRRSLGVLTGWGVMATGAIALGWLGAGLVG